MKKMPSIAHLIWLCLILLLIATSAFRPASAGQVACTYWVAPAPEGDDSQNGSASAPWATLQHAAANAADNHCTILFRDGLYDGEHRISRRFETPTTFRAVNPYQVAFENNDTTVNIDGARNLIFEGFEFRHRGPGAGALVVSVHSDEGEIWAEEITFRNNIFHDSYNNDLLKLYNGVRSTLVEGNIFYNQGPGEEHIDVNSVVDVVFRQNIFFNDYAGSDRDQAENTKHYLLIKDSGGGADGLRGSERVTVDGNIFLNWRGAKSFFVKVGSDGKSYYEAKQVQITNNLFIGNTQEPLQAAVGMSGVRDVYFTNNTTVGDMPGDAYAYELFLKGDNRTNENIYFYNNIWSDPTGTMGTEQANREGRFAAGPRRETNNLVLEHNLYWNGGKKLPAGLLGNPLVIDPEASSGDPGLAGDQSAVLLPRWDGDRFPSGSQSIRDEFVRLVERYGSLPPSSPAIGQADPDMAPAHDILGQLRTATPDLGAYEYQPRLHALRFFNVILLGWTAIREPEATHLMLTYRSNNDSGVVKLPVGATFHTLPELPQSELYQLQVTAYNADGEILTSTNSVEISNIGLWLR